MAEESPETPHAKRCPHSVAILRETWNETELRTVVVEDLGASLMTVILAGAFHFTSREEFPELVFLAVCSGICGVIIGFFYRFIFVTPGNMYRQLEDKLAKYESLIIHSAHWGVEGRLFNVTTIAVSRLNVGKLELPCEINVLGEPRERLGKILTIDYSFGGKRLERSFKEHEIARLP